MRRAAAATDELRSEAQKGPLRRTLLFVVPVGRFSHRHPTVWDCGDWMATGSLACTAALPGEKPEERRQGAWIAVLEVDRGVH